MDKFIIEGGLKLEGKVKASGAKNSSLALMPACLLNDEVNIIHNTPRVNDIFTMKKLLTHMGVDVEFNDYTLRINSKNLSTQVAPYEHVKKMRASVYVLGPLLARYGFAKVSLPGGCAWGPRPINLHLESMKKLGAEILIEEGYIIAKSKKLNGAKINFDVSSVGATGNILMAAVLASGTTKITNAATEPEIVQLTEMLIQMGARIEGVGTPNLEIEGVNSLKSAEIVSISDRIEAGTLIIAGAITKSKITVEVSNPEHLTSILGKLEDTGCKIKVRDEEIEIDSSDIDLNSVDVTTAIYPGFPTDMQAQWTALMSLAKGTATITDTIYIDRFNHIPELIRLGADIETIRNSAVVKGVKKLSGAKVMSTDLRASASLVLAGLAAEGATEVLRIYHLDRGYQRIEEKLTQLGASIERIPTTEF